MIWLTSSRAVQTYREVTAEEQEAVREMDAARLRDMEAQANQCCQMEGE